LPLSSSILTLPDSQGFEAFDKLFNAARGIPILILGENVSEGIAKLAVGRGAQDYLLPDHLDILWRVLCAMPSNVEP
jgi:DNA-binding response OmpR family regulator